jgi:hypothetical protein
MSRYSQILGGGPRVSNFYERLCLPENRFHIVPYPEPTSSSQSQNLDFINHFRSHFLTNAGDGLKFRGYWAAIQLYGGEEGMFDDMRETIAQNFVKWCRTAPDALDGFRSQARERGYEYPDTSNLDNTIYANVDKPFTASLEEAKKFVLTNPQPRWIRGRRSHPASEHRQKWPGMELVWPESQSTSTSANGEHNDAANEPEHAGPQAAEAAQPDSLSSQAGVVDSTSQSFKKALKLLQQAVDGEVSWKEFVKQAEDVVASAPPISDSNIDSADSREAGVTASPTVVASPPAENPGSRSAEPQARQHAADINPRKRALEDADPAGGARPRPGPAPARQAIEHGFYEEAMLDLSRALSGPSRRLIVRKTTYEGQTWHILAWGSQAVGMSAGLGRAMHWIFKNHIEASSTWSGLSLQLALRFSGMEQYTALQQVRKASSLSRRTVKHLARRAYFRSSMSIAEQAKTAAALVSRLMDGGEGMVLQRMKRLSVADLISEGAAIDDSGVAAILGGDPEEYMGNGADQVYRAGLPDFVELE